MPDFKPKKSLGQNYLRDQNIVKKIIAELEPGNNDHIIEIGPGQGAITKHLSDSTAAKITAIEIDKRVIDDLSVKYKNVKFVNEDFLDTELEIFDDEKQLRIIGNIPYNITSPIIFKLLANRDLINDAVLMIQYEVAKRIAAQPGTKDYGILSVILNYLSTVKFCFKVSANVFRPKPKVDSAAIHIYFDKKNFDVDTNLFIKVVKACFGNRRKTLKNSLSNSIFKNYDLSCIDFDLSRRAEQLTITEFIQLTKIMSSLWQT